MGNMMYNRRLLIGFLVLVSTAHCLTCRTEITKPVEYTCDEQGQTLIFRRQPLWYDVVPVMSVFLVGLGFFAFRSEFTPTKNAPAVKAIAIILPSAMGSLGIADFLYKKYRMKDPILILNKKGIWHEPWNTQILWSDVTCVECKKVDQYVSHCVGQAPILIHYETHIGFSWEIRLHTKDKVWTIDERSTQIWNALGTRLARSSDSLEQDGGELGKLVRECYRKGMI